MSTKKGHEMLVRPNDAVEGAQDALSRRGFLGNVYTGMAGMGLAHLLGSEASADALPSEDAAQKKPAKARRVLQIFCPGAASHMDLWEHKPALAKYHGKPLPGAENFLSFQGKNGNLMKSPWDFVPCGESGNEITSLLPYMATHVDDIAFWHGMQSKSNTHGPACVFMNTGQPLEGSPAAGSWLSYALGSENEDLPAFVAIPDIRGEPPNGKANWANGFLPAKHQAIVLSSQQPIRNLEVPKGIGAQEERSTREFLRRLNERHAAERPGETDLEARIAAYQLAARMQLSAPEVADLTQESQSTLDAYGVNDSNHLKAAYAKNCLLSRRLLERGVRYVNLYCASRASGVDGLLNWDAHKSLKPDYERHCPVFDQPTAALLTDLKQSGLLDETIVLWTTEFGRMPTHQQGTSGRDHNPDGFSCWMMGAGIKGGTSYGATDEFGRRAVEDVSTVWDFYATVLHLMGLDHEKVTFYHNGLDRRLTDVHGRVIDEVLS